MAFPKKTITDEKIFCILVLSSSFFFFFFHSSVFVGAQTTFITRKDFAVDNDVNEFNEYSAVIVVSKDGRGDSLTVQGAVDLVPDLNTRRIKIFVSPGVYREKVVIPSTKPFISFIAHPNSTTVLSWNSKASDPSPTGDGIVGTYNSASVAVESDYFIASDITFENTSGDAPPGSVGLQAVALRVTGDKAVFYRCRFLGSQDTLFDHIGRHLFLQCYIRGSIDFIFGSARSLYEDCEIESTARSSGAIAASQRNGYDDICGFSFFNCRVRGSGKVYLGRAWGRFSRIIYAFCEMEGIVIPQGWNDWGDSTRRFTTLFAEFNCTGPGSDRSQRVPWMTSLTYDQIRQFTDRSYIDDQEWLRI